MGSIGFIEWKSKGERGKTVSGMEGETQKTHIFGLIDLSSLLFGIAFCWTTLLSVNRCQSPHFPEVKSKHEKNSLNSRA
jgi:hypothetical protein